MDSDFNNDKSVHERHVLNSVAPIICGRLLIKSRPKSILSVGYIERRDSSDSVLFAEDIGCNNNF